MKLPARNGIYLSRCVRVYDTEIVPCRQGRVTQASPHSLRNTSKIRKPGEYMTKHEKTLKVFE